MGPHPKPAAPRAVWPLAGLALVVACGASGEEGPPTGEDRPFRDDWRLEFSAPFPYAPESEDPGIERIFIGEAAPELGATNRGDIMVEFDAPAETIEVELRRFTFAGSDAAAAEDFERIAVVARDADGHDCTVRWWDGCTLTLAHAGQTQPLRAGADMRVHLPADYRHRLRIEAHDVAGESDYPDRADVCLRGLSGDADVVLDSGVVVAVFSDATTPAPTCTTAEIEECEAEAWASCGCTFGRLASTTRELGRSDMTVDVPHGLWASVSLSNVDTQGESCMLDIDVPGVELGSVSPVHVDGELARPDGAPANLPGYGIELRSVQCSEVAYVNGPAEFEMPLNERRGDLRVCSGCLGATGCEDLLAGEPSG